MNVNFSTAIKLYFANYANFKGRSTRAEYWWAMLFVFILNIITLKIPYFSAVIGLGLIIPNLAIVTRRFHDSGRSDGGYSYFWLPRLSAVPLLWRAYSLQ